MLRELAHRSGLSCGHCRNRKGKSCAHLPCCSRWGLHKFRKTFATMHHRAGVSLTDLMLWLGHSDLATTQAYLAGSQVQSATIRAQVDSSFGGLVT